MTKRKRMEWVRWAQAATCVALTYATLNSARAVVDALRDRNQLRVTVAGLFILVGAMIAVAVLRRRPSRSEVRVLALSAVVYAVLLPLLERAEERLHFLQYGLIGALVYSALDHRWVRPGVRSEGVAAAVAIAIVLVVGWVDEGIQYFLPERYYDLRDVAFNLIAGALAVAISVAFRRARRGAGDGE